MIGITIRKTATRNDLTVDGQVIDLSDKKNANRASELTVKFLEDKGYFVKK